MTLDRVFTSDLGFSNPLAGKVEKELWVLSQSFTPQEILKTCSVPGTAPGYGNIEGIKRATITDQIRLFKMAMRGKAQCREYSIVITVYGARQMPGLLGEWSITSQIT